jgi:hypothetical protein
VTRLTCAVVVPTFLLVLDGVPRNRTAILLLDPLHPLCMLVPGKLPPTTMKTWTHVSHVVLHHSLTRRFLLLSPLEVVIVSLHCRRSAVFLGSPQFSLKIGVIPSCSPCNDSTGLDTPFLRYPFSFPYYALFLERLVIFSSITWQCGSFWRVAFWCI